MRPPSEEVVARVLEALERYPEGVHRLREPAYLFDVELPESLAEVYRSFDGGELFHESLVLYPSASLRREGDRFHVGEIGGDDLFVDAAGTVWRRDAESELELPEASGLDRWLSGYVDAEALILDAEGEFRDGVFTEHGELEPEIAMRRERCMIKRDPGAVGARFRLGLELRRRGELEAARECFEEAVARMPELAAGWFNLGRISEALGDAEGALEELVEGAAVGRGGELEPMLWASAARLAAALGDDARRRDLAAKALAADPGLIDQLVRGATAELEAGREDEARALVELGRAVAPTHLGVLDLARRLS